MRNSSELSADQEGGKACGISESVWSSTPPPPDLRQVVNTSHSRTHRPLGRYDITIYNKKYVFGLPSTSDTELLKSLECSSDKSDIHNKPLSVIPKFMLMRWLGMHLRMGAGYQGNQPAAIRRLETSVPPLDLRGGNTG